MSADGGEADLKADIARLPRLTRRHLISARDFRISSRTLGGGFGRTLDAIHSFHTRLDELRCGICRTGSRTITFSGKQCP
jgi:hypothetical protein